MAQNSSRDRTDDLPVLGEDTHQLDAPSEERSIANASAAFQLPQDESGDHADDEAAKPGRSTAGIADNKPKSPVMRHKQRSKKHEGDSRESVTRHTVFPSKQDARRQRFSQRPGGVMLTMKYRRDLVFKDLQRDREAMGPIDRLRKRFSFLNPHSEDSDDEASSCKQYTIPPPNDDGNSLLYGVMAFLSMKFIDLIFWMFKTSFFNVMVMFLMTYLVFVNLLTVIIYGIVTHLYHKSGGVCIDGWDYVGDSGGAGLNWELSFSLSWTSFSTVGFGTVSPAIEAGCYGLRYACAIEAFLGVLFAGFCSAIFFAKFSRLMGRAQVVFSSTICIQYGEGAQGHQDRTSTGSGNPGSNFEDSQGNIPYPVFEFRIVNTRANEKGCEILDATISCLVCVNEVLGAAGTSAIPEGRNSPEKVAVFDESSGVKEKIPLFKQNYHNMSISSRHHPYFRRVWYLRHVLDANSPIVKPEVRSRIKQCGHWPNSLNDHRSVRNSLIPFQNIIVTLNGTSNLNASDVFQQYKYKFRDVHVGWQFAGMMYFGRRLKGKEKRMKVDTTLVHDIVPQNGGGNEPIGVVEE